MYVLYTHTIYTSLPTYLPTYVCEICATSPRPRRAALSCGLRLRFWADPRNRRAWPLRAQRGVPGAGGSAMATGGPWGITQDENDIWLEWDVVDDMGMQQKWMGPVWSHTGEVLLPWNYVGLCKKGPFPGKWWLANMGGLWDGYAVLMNIVFTGWGCWAMNPVRQTWTRWFLGQLNGQFTPLFWYFWTCRKINDIVWQALRVPNAEVGLTRPSFSE